VEQPVLRARDHEQARACPRGLQPGPADAPRIRQCLDSRALIYLKLDETARAIADYDAALRLDRARPIPLRRGLARRRLGDLAGAEADLAAAIVLAPRVAEEYSTYGLRP